MERDSSLLIKKIQKEIEVTIPATTIVNYYQYNIEITDNEGNFLFDISIKSKTFLYEDGDQFDEIVEVYLDYDTHCLYKNKDLILPIPPNGKEVLYAIANAFMDKDFMIKVQKL